MRIYVCLVALLVFGCEKNDIGVQHPLPVSINPLPVPMKGYELYSWKAGGKWKYTLITGTNRLKTFTEISTSANVETEEWVKITVYDAQALKALLNRVPSGQSVVWSHDFVSGCALPPSIVVEDIKEFCSKLNLDFHVSG